MNEIEQILFSFSVDAIRKDPMVLVQQAEQGRVRNSAHFTLVGTGYRTCFGSRFDRVPIRIDDLNSEAVEVDQLIKYPGVADSECRT